MRIQLTLEQLEALRHCPDGVECQGDTEQVFVIVNGETHRRAMAALRAQQDWESLNRGAAQADAGEGIPLDEADRRIRQRLRITDRQ